MIEIKRFLDKDFLKDLKKLIIDTAWFKKTMTNTTNNLLFLSLIL